MIEFEFLGKPVGQGRPKFSTRGGFVRAIDPQKSRDYKSYVKAVVAEKISQIKGFQPMQGAICLKLIAVLAIPKSKPKKFREAALTGKVHPTVKPDIDNIYKIVTDAMQGIVYEDDKQIIDAALNKRYGLQPRVVVQIYEVKNVD